MVQSSTKIGFHNYTFATAKLHSPLHKGKDCLLVMAMAMPGNWLSESQLALAPSASLAMKKAGYTHSLLSEQKEVLKIARNISLTRELQH